jgi:hypothetical protein
MGPQSICSPTERWTDRKPDRRSLLFLLLQRLRSPTGELVSLYASDKAAINQMVMALVALSPLSFLLKLIRLPSTLSTVPTWTPPHR